MIVRGPRPARNFYILDKEISEDSRLSWGARGLLVYLLGKPDHWQISPAALVNATVKSAKPSGRDAVYGLLNELQTVGYMVRHQARGEGGTLGPVNYLVGEMATPPLTENTEAAPLTALPYPAEPYPANPTQVSIEKYQGLISDQVSKKKKSAPQKNEISFNAATFNFDGIDCDQKGRWKAAFPATNIDAELLRAALWLKANPANRKSNYEKFLNNWLTRSQDKAPRQQTGAGNGYQQPARRATAGECRDDFNNSLRAHHDRIFSAEFNTIDMPQ